MTWTFDASNANTETGRLDAVRILVGDTDIGDQKITDEEITFLLSQTNNDVYLAAAQSARAIAAKYASQVNSDFESISADLGDVSKNYYLLATKLDMQAKKFGSRGLGMPAAGGISVSEMDAVDEDTDRVRPKFRQDQFANPSPDNDYEP